VIVHDLLLLIMGSLNCAIAIFQTGYHVFCVAAICLEMEELSARIPLFEPHKM
jgi:hypothetical protein